MIAIAESGSTKCDWVLLDNNNQPCHRFNTMGFNPYFHSANFVAETLNECVELTEVKDQIKGVYFYGAGCSSERLNQRIELGLRQVFKDACISVDHDLVAAAFALYDGEPNISCIIGTGSNSCFFDGSEFDEGIHALGFILGDEAGGSFFGKQLLADYFYGELPEEIHQAFGAKYGLEWEDVVPKVYNNLHANVYLASYMPFIASFKAHKYVKEMVSKGIGRFIDVHVAKFPDFKKYKVGFVGTIAYVFEDILKEELVKRGCRPGLIVKNPIDRLIAYHINYPSVMSA